MNYNTGKEWLLTALLKLLIFSIVTVRNLVKTASYDHIEKHILPLVDGLRAIPGVNTHSSCEGHYDHRGLTAWVVFSCMDVRWPYALWNRLKEVHSPDRELSYHWTIRPWVNLNEGRPCFVLEGQPTGNRMELFRKCVLQGKKYLLRDIEKIRDNLRVLDAVEYRVDCETPGKKLMPPPIEETFAGVYSLAVPVGTNRGIGSDLLTTTVTMSELRHALIYQITSANTRNRRGRKRFFAIIIAPMIYYRQLCKLVNELWALATDGAFVRPASRRSGWFGAESYFANSEDVVVKLYLP
ncbi:Uncharacterised protein [uncultured archaeon]|nr:Uncharacterised protein [uncultured archaeon]